jgi:hypothetical protein
MGAGLWIKQMCAKPLREWVGTIAGYGYSIVGCFHKQLAKSRLLDICRDDLG